MPQQKSGKEGAKDVVEQARQRLSENPSAEDLRAIAADLNDAANEMGFEPDSSKPYDQGAGLM